MEEILNSLTDVTTYVVPIAIFIAIMAFILAYLTPKMSKSDIGTMELMESLGKSEIAEENELKANVRQRELDKLGFWYKRWYKVFSKAAIGKIEDVKQPGTVAFMFVLIGLGAGLVLMKAPGVLIGPAVAVIALNSIKGSQASKKNRQFDSQLGLLIDAMSQNIQGAMSPRNALVDSIEGLPEPLHSELLSVKYDLEVGTPIDEVLQDLGDRNESREMKFLSAALRISIEQGGDLKPQLKVISDKLEGRARITRKINEAVAQTKPTILVVALATPVSAIYAYTREGAAEAFTSTIGMAAAAVGFILYGIGLWLIMKMVAKTKEF